jgi:hypothetical protein
MVWSGAPAQWCLKGSPDQSCRRAPEAVAFLSRGLGQHFHQLASVDPNPPDEDRLVGRHLAQRGEQRAFKMHGQQRRRVGHLHFSPICNQENSVTGRFTKRLNKYF